MTPMKLMSLDPEEEMEREWLPAFVHEGGHTLMAVLQQIKCEGIGYEMDKGQFCTLITPPSGKPSEKDYLCLAAGAAADCLKYGSYDNDATANDRKLFEPSGAPSFDETVAKARTILSRNMLHHETLISKLKEKVKALDYDLPLHVSPQVISGKRYFVLLSEEELENIAIP
jgi:hypothetical protein